MPLPCATRNERIVQYRGVMLDISGLKTFQSELQRERDFSGKILNNTQSLILVADTGGWSAMPTAAGMKWAISSNRSWAGRWKN